MRARSRARGVFRDVEEPVYLDDCCHLDALGNELRGAAIGRIMASAPALAAGSR